MIVTPHFVFLHLHRTGGRFVRQLLLDQVEGSREIGYHFPAALIPASHRHLPVLGLVRDPWDWYVSWYEFNRARPRSAIFTVASAGGRLDFRHTLLNMLWLGSDEPRMRQLKSDMIGQLPRSILGNRGAGITQHDLAGFNCGQTGYYSWLVQHMYGARLLQPDMLLGHFENLREDLLRLLLESGCKLTAAMVQTLRTAAPANASCRGITAEYYDAETWQAVAHQEAWICRQFDYPASRSDSFAVPE
ncbi:MAG: hypothetical protein HPY82_06990 [Gammaproteobacteria bacterium]|nr:hypothetical protein [Gammaproteobacteria bacterium]